MTLTLTRDDDTISPHLIDGYDSTRSGGAIVHRIIGTNDVEITDRPSGPRSGTLRLFFGPDPSTAETDSATAEQLLAEGGVWTWTDTDRPSFTFTFVVLSGLERRLEENSRDLWWVLVPFQEVAT